MNSRGPVVVQRFTGCGLRTACGQLALSNHNSNANTLPHEGFSYEGLLMLIPPPPI